MNKIFSKALQVISLVALFFLPASLHASADPNSILNKWNAIIVKDFQNVSEIEGRTFVGGNYSVSNSHQFGFKLTGNPVSDIVFAVKGSVTTNGMANIKVFNGSAAVSSAVSNTSWFSFQTSGGTLKAQSTWPADNSPVNDIIAASNYWKTLQSNSTVQIPSGQPGPLRFNCSADQAVAVFSVTDAQIFENSYVQQFDLVTTAATKTVIINVNSLDGNINWNSGNMTGNFTSDYWRARVIWNVYTTANNGDMGTINFNSGLGGTLIAPTATLTTNSNIDGCVVVENLNIQSEIHNPSGGWAGNLPVPTVVTPGVTDWSVTLGPDSAICEHDAKWIPVSGSVHLTPNPSIAYLQTSWRIVKPDDGSVDNSTHYSTVRITKDTAFSISAYWPGVRPDDQVVEIHYGVNVLDINNNPIKNGAGRDLYWYPYVCPPPAPKEADVKITKTASSLNPKYGDNVTYTIKAVNLGPGEAKGILVSELLPSAVIYVSHSTAQGTYDQQTGVWTIGNLTKDQEATLTITVKIDDSQMNSTAFDLGAAKDYNLFVLQDATQPSSDTQGKAAIGRDASFGSYSIGDQLSPNSGDVLIVGRNLTFTSGRIYNGNAVYGSSTNLPLSSVSVDGQLRKDSPVNFTAAKAYLENLSTTLGSYAVNGTAKFEWGGLFLSGTDPFLNVFSVKGSDLSSANNFQIDVPNGAVVLVNISGTQVNWTGGLVVNGTAITNVLYNFYQAADLAIRGIDVRGSILAPFASVNFTSGVQNGQMICKSLTGQGQFNNSKFLGNIPYDKKITNIASISASLTTDPVQDNNSASVTITASSSTGGSNGGGNNGGGTTGDNTNWQQVSSFTQGEIVYSMLYDASSMYAGTVGGKIYRSTDSGKNWTRINNDMNVGWIWSLCMNNNQLFAATEKGVYKLNGTAWSLTSLSGKDVHAIISNNGALIAGTWGYGIYRSTDNGSSWSEFNEGLGIYTVIQTLAMDKKGNLFAGSAGGGIFKMRSGESKWCRHEVGNNVVWSLGASGSTIYAGLYSDGLYNSTDEGENWQKVNSPNLPFVYSIASDINDNVYLSSWSGGVYVISKDQSSSQSLGMGGTGVSSILVSSSGKEIFVGTKDGKVYLTAGIAGTTSVEKEPSTPEEFRLLQNYPNPFNPSTVIKFSIPAAGHYTLKVYDILGKEVADLVNDNLSAGNFTVRFDAARLSAGIYIYQLTGANVNMVRKMVLVK